MRIGLFGLAQRLIRMMKSPNAALMPPNARFSAYFLAKLADPHGFRNHVFMCNYL